LPKGKSSSTSTCPSSYIVSQHWLLLFFPDNKKGTFHKWSKFIVTVHQASKACQLTLFNFPSILEPFYKRLPKNATNH
jgi:hypothetical protein